ncbi:MAG TPA: YjbQ family protein [Candidatus Omnitrophica bacterium]|nr:YjbQ family protein [Candidatus Omnitrophota bacterium]
MIERITLNTSSSEEFMDITSLIEEKVRSSGINNGIVTIFVPHTTAAVTINENADPSVVKDILSTLHRIVPPQGSYFHMEGNAHAHIKSSIIGSSRQIIIENGRLKLGTWQGIFFCEFDGPRRREVWVKINLA